MQQYGHTNGICSQKLKNYLCHQQKKIEGIDNLKLIENGIKIRVVLTEKITETVDTQNDLNKVIEMMKKDELMGEYIQIY